MIVTVDTQGPRVDSIGTLEQSDTSLDVTFVDGIAPATFTPDDVVLTGPSGPITVTGITQLADNIYRIHFAALTETGEYTIQIGPDIDDVAGNAMDQNGDGTPGDAFTDTIQVLDTTPPAVTAFSPTGILVTDVTSFGVEFSEPMLGTSFTAEDVAVTLPGDTLLDPSAISINQDTPTTFTVTISSALSAEGTYGVQIGPAVTGPGR